MAPVLYLEPAAVLTPALGLIVQVALFTLKAVIEKVVLPPVLMLAPAELETMMAEGVAQSW